MSNIILNPGSGGSTLGTDTVAGTDYQIVKIGYAVAGGAPVQVSLSNPLPVVQTGAIPAGGNVIGAVTQSGGPWTDNLTQVGGTAVDTNSGVKSAGTLRVILATDQPSLTNAIPVAQSGSWTVTVNGTVTANAGTGTFAISAASLPLPTGAATAAKQPALGTAGTASSDVITVQGIAAMTPLSVTGTFFQGTQPVSGTVTANAGTGTFATSLASLPALATGANTIGAVTQASGPWTVNTTQLGGTAIDTNSGVKSAGTQRVVIATDQPSLTNALPVTQSGTWTVQIGNTPNTTPILTSNTASAAGGSSVSSFLSTAAVQATNVKASAGTIYSLEFFNTGTTPVFLRLYDKATAPLTSDTPIWRGAVPGNAGGAGFVVRFGVGLKTTTGIGFRCTGAVADNDATILVANGVLGNVEFA